MPSVVTWEYQRLEPTLPIKPMALEASMHDARIYISADRVDNQLKRSVNIGIGVKRTAFRFSKCPLKRSENRMNRVFVATYDSEDNYTTTRHQGVLGASNTYRNFEPRFRSLHPGNLVLIRDRTRRGRQRLRFFGHCVVTGPPLRQGQDASPYDDLLWPDERSEGRIIYPWRIRVDFEDVPNLPGLYTRDWEDWIGLGLLGVRGRKIETRQQLGLLFRGNFIPSRDLPAVTRGLQRLLSRRGGYADAGNTDKIGEAGEKYVLQLLRKEFGTKAVDIIWQRPTNRFAPYDIEVKLPNTDLTPNVVHFLC